MRGIRRVARFAVLVTAGIAVALAGSHSAGAQEEHQRVSAEIGYLCGTQAVQLRVTATFPARGAVGAPIEPADVLLELAVPPEAMAGLTAAGAVAATSAVRLETSVVQGETTANATWATVQDEKVPLVADGPTSFGGAVKVEPITVDTAGEVSFTAVGLVATLTGWTEDGVVTEPPTAELTCIPDPEAKATVAVVPVTATDTPSTGPTTGTPPEKGRIKVGTGTKEQLAPFVSALGPPPKDCHPIKPPEARTWQDLCAYMAGYSNVAKLNASVLQPAALINIAAGAFVRNCDGNRFKWCSDNNVLPDLNGEPKLPEAEGSFFAFGFVPVTGKMQLTQLDVGNVDVWLIVNDASQGEAVARLQVSVRLFDTEVNGVPLDLGPNCVTATPIDVVLTARAGTYSITEGGILTGMITIPPFTGCGADEDLDPIITGLVSGPGNYVKMTQGPVCTINTQYRCPPAVPVPQR